MTGPANGVTRRRRPKEQTVRELFRPSTPLKDRTPEETAATAEAWAYASAYASKVAPGGVIGGKKREGS